MEAQGWARTIAEMVSGVVHTTELGHVSGEPRYVRASLAQTAAGKETGEGALVSADSKACHNQSRTDVEVVSVCDSVIAVTRLNIRTHTPNPHSNVLLSLFSILLQLFFTTPHLSFLAY